MQETINNKVSLEMISTNKKNWTNLLLTTVLYLGAIFLFVNHLRFNLNSRSQMQPHRNYIDIVIGEKNENLKKSISAISQENSQMIGLNVISIIVSTLLFASFLASFFEKRSVVVQKEIIKEPSQNLQTVLNQLDHAVVQLNPANEVVWMNLRAQKIISGTTRLKKIIESSRKNNNGNLIARFNLTSFEIFDTKLQNGDNFLYFIPLMTEDYEFNQIKNKKKLELQTKLQNDLQPQLSSVVADLLVEHNFIFQASNTMIEIEPSQTTLLVGVQDIKPYLKSFVLSIHQFIKDSKSSNLMHISINEIDERAIVTVCVNRLNLASQLNELPVNVKEIFSKFDEVETQLSSKFCTISMRQINSANSQVCEFSLSFENIPTLTDFKLNQSNVTAS